MIKKVLKIIGIGIGGLIVVVMIIGVVLKIVDPEGVERRASDRIEAAKEAREAKKIEQAKQVEKPIYKQIAQHVTFEDERVTDMIISYYTTETDPKKIKKFSGKRFKLFSAMRVVVIFFNDKKHIPSAGQLEDWWTDGSAMTKKNKKRLFRDYYVACYRSYPKIKRGPKKGFQFTEFFSETTGSCGL